MPEKVKNWLILLGDAGLMYVSLALALILRGRSDLLADFWPAYFWPFTILNAIWVAVFFINDFYSNRRRRLNVDFLQGFIRAMLFNALAAVVFFYLIQAFGITPKTTLVIHLAVYSVLFCGWRALAAALTGSRLKRVVFLEIDNYESRLVDLIACDPTTGHCVVGVIQPSGRSVRLPEGVARHADLGRLEELAAAGQVEIVVVGQEAFRQTDPRLYNLMLRGIEVLDAPTFWQKLHQQVPIEAADFGWFLNNFSDASKRDFEAVKRVYDLVGALVIGTALSPVLGVVALAVKLSSPGPVLYRQERVGRLGRPFRVLKFRSMRLDAEKSGAQWSPKDDGRVTPVGRFLRYTHLDELPQLWNIIRGEMAFVGPRPERPVFVAELKRVIPFYDLRHLVKPGVSGWAQISYRYGASVDDAAKKLAYDLFYVKNRSAAFDLKIALKTAAMVFRGEGR